MRTSLRVLVVALTALIAGAITGATSVGAASFAYDAPTAARVDVRELRLPAQSQRSSAGSQDGSASPSAAAQGGTSTIPSSRSVATHKVAATGEDLLKPGPWAEGSVPTSAPGKITQAERNALNRIGDEFGCHSCGTTTPGTKSGNWVGDHQPVSSHVPPGTPQVLYPQCLTCSNDKGLYIINMMRQGPR